MVLLQQAHAVNKDDVQLHSRALGFLAAGQVARVHGLSVHDERTVLSRDIVRVRVALDVDGRRTQEQRHLVKARWGEHSP